MSGLHLPTLNKIEQCGSCPFGGLTPGCPMHEVRRPIGTVLLEQDAVPSQVWLVREGTIMLSAVSASGDELLCALRGPGSLLGLEALKNAPMMSQAWALSDVVVCGLEGGAFREWVGGQATPTGAVLDLALGEILRRSEERIALAGRAVARLARFLLEKRKLEGEDRPLHVQHRLLARMLGMRAETLSRAIAKLRDAGALGPGPGVHVADAVAMERIAGEAETPDHDLHDLVD